jgi:Flp pilus assembly protein TadG
MRHVLQQLRARLRHRRGANAIEFALTAPVFFAITMGIVDYGYLFMMQSGIDSAVSLACREGAKVDPSRGNPSSIAQSELNSRAAYFCNGHCSTLTAVEMIGAQWAAPNRTLVCTAIMPNPPQLVGLVPYPTQISSVSYYRLEWQRATAN